MVDNFLWSFEAIKRMRYQEQIPYANTKKSTERTRTDKSTFCKRMKDSIDLADLRMRYIDLCEE